MKTLYLIPNALSSTPEGYSLLPSGLGPLIDSLDGLFIESERYTGRLFKYSGVRKHIRDVRHVIIDQNVKDGFITEQLRQIKDTERWGIVSDAGLPVIADPGAKIVKQARSLGFRIIPLPGPSSVFLGLMASGMNGQRFAFHGYLPINKPERIAILKHLERESEARDQTQILIESPHRNPDCLELCLATLRPDTRLCVCWDLTGPDETIISQAVSAFNKETKIPDTMPAIFLLNAFKE